MERNTMETSNQNWAVWKYLHNVLIYLSIAAIEVFLQVLITVLKDQG